MDDLLAPKLVTEQDIENLFQNALRLMKIEEADEDAATNPA
jgi:hypothetical protein